ncbi:unnamed protein product [Porites lobata]|uniref:Uncharacterized protein n=1 Tax=Porites lobata TaxID=104759 RepID=A0ABN8QZW1_9CNID|nr:unnamed protein product [Porites lobata]
MDCVGPSNLEKFVAVWDFEPSKKDEVALSKGDVVFVLKKYKDGWYRGIRYRGYQAGCFPGNFVVKDSDKAENIEWQDASKEFLSNSSPATEVNTNILADLEINRGSMTSEGTGTEDQYKDMEDRQPNVNQNGVDRSDSLSSDNSGGLSPGTFTSFHGLNIIADSMSRDGAESEERKRTKAAMELLTSEVSYFNGLNLLSGHYIRPLRKLRIISSEDLKKIFANAESLETISKELVAKLQTRLAHWDVNTTLIGDILVEMFSYVMMFEPYFKSRKRGNEVKVKLEKNNEKFRNFLAKVNCNQTLDSLLLMPIQRVPRYELILKELVKRTSKDHPDYDNLTEALSKAQKTAEALNEHIRQIENETKVVEVIKSFPNDELNLIRPAVLNSPGKQLFVGSVRLRKHDKDHMATLSKSLKRISLPLMDTIDTSPNLPRRGSSAVAHDSRPKSAENSDSDSDTETSSLGDTFITSTYIYDGDVERVTKKATGSSEGGMVHETVERHLFLFNHVLLVGLASENLITGKKTYKLKHNIPLAQAWVTPPSAYYTSPPENMFILGTPTQIYKFLAPSEREKTTWVKKLKTYIEKEKQAFVEFFKGLPVPDEQFLAVSIQSKIDYHKTVDLELNLRQGEEVLIIGIKSGGLWLPGLYAVNVCEIELAWWPGLHKGRFGWFPAQCVTGPDVTSITSTNEFHPIPVAVALNVIKRTMMKWTSSSAAIPIYEDPMTLKVFKPDKTFKTCKVHTDCLVSGVLHQYTRHKSFAGGNIDVAVLELWEESLDGSVRRCLDPDEKLVDIFTMWGKYQDKMKLVIHSSKEGQRTLSKKSKKDSKDEPPTGDLITFD